MEGRARCVCVRVDLSVLSLSVLRWKLSSEPKIIDKSRIPLYHAAVWTFVLGRTDIIRHKYAADVSEGKTGLILIRNFSFGFAHITQTYVNSWWANTWKQFHGMQIIGSFLYFTLGANKQNKKSGSKTMWAIKTSVQADRIWVSSRREE
jgi:hypothetical protein